MNINNFLDFSDFFWELFGGSGVGGPELLFLRLFRDFSGFRGLGSVDGRGDPKARLIFSFPLENVNPEGRS